ncbi:hypothetical protein C8R44DRAFT_326384 [Mycena epipterygia]|nr:hypothetical protein C8R44DRAFT_326384 [Mycena epipterygia]
MKITEAKLQFLVAIEMTKTQIRQREQTYPVFGLADLELVQVLNQTNPKHTRAIARLVPHRKPVLLRQYQTKSNFFEDIENLTALRYKVPPSGLIFVPLKS